MLARYPAVFGIPADTLYLLAVPPVIFAVYDLCCFLLVGQRLAVCLKILAALNLSYCFLSLGLAVYHRSSITAWGWGYLGLEVVVVLLLVMVEWRVERRLA
ncbi:MAG: hypothetical protein WBA17_12490 [Saprospiraceae bacterium]